MIFLIMSAGNAAGTAGAIDIDIEKLTLGTDGIWYDADVAPGPEIPVGDPVQWKYVVTNTGDITLVEIKVTDDQIGQIGTIDDLGANGVVEFTVTSTAESGQYVNVGTVEAVDEVVGLLISDTDSSHYFGIEDNEIPEFPTITLPILAIMGLAFVFMRRRE
ncbi:PEF-CTERM sorting domain-containing protein [Methanolobus sp. ZRKC3]|uniref:PEF-CTERM sorting domain-containing protein n=1 Tax=Methanolobus sp. ZRKC3 TaxID=3125786 RepID=UPI00324DEB08